MSSLCPFCPTSHITAPASTQPSLEACLALTGVRSLFLFLFSSRRHLCLNRAAMRAEKVLGFPLPCPSANHGLRSTRAAPAVIFSAAGRRGRPGARTRASKHRAGLYQILPALTFCFWGQEPPGFSPARRCPHICPSEQGGRGSWALNSPVAETYIFSFCLHSISFEGVSLCSPVSVTYAWRPTQVLGALEGG